MIFTRGDHAELASHLLKKLSLEKEGLVFDEDTLYQYQPSHGVWAPVDNDYLSTAIQKLAGTPVMAYGGKGLTVKQYDVDGTIKMIKSQAARTGFFSDAPPGLAYANKVFVSITPNGVQKEKLGKQHKVRTVFNFDYDPKARSPEFQKFVNKLFEGDEDAQQKKDFLQEIFGASLARCATKLQRCALLIGDGGNGKDTLIEVLKDVFPPGTVAHSPPHRWKHEYARADLSGKWLNVVGELPEVELESSDTFKAIVSGSPVDARNPYGKFHTVTPEAGHIFALNTMLHTPDFSRGFFRRFGIVRFNRTFDDQGDRNIPERMRQFRPAIAAWLLEGAARVLARGNYVLPTSHAKEAQDWRLQADQVAMYIESCCRVAEDEATWVRADLLFQAYAEWARANEHRPVSSTKFGLRIKLLLKEKKLPEAKRAAKGIRYPLIPVK